jgi:hypothetical protein
MRVRATVRGVPDNRKTSYRPLAGFSHLWSQRSSSPISFMSSDRHIPHTTMMGRCRPSSADVVYQSGNYIAKWKQSPNSTSSNNTSREFAGYMLDT